MAWIELHQAVWTHRKTYLLADRLQLDETYAAAHVIRLWSWALDNAAEGWIPDATDRVIARAADWKGDAQPFVAALVEAGWLDRDAAINGYRIHDWERYAGRLIERRRQDADRLRRWREAHRDETRTKPVPNGVTVPNRTGPDRTLETKQSVSPGPEGVQGEPFAADAAPPNGQHAAIRPVPKPKPDLGPLVDAFSAQGLPRPDLADPAERQAAMQLLRSHPPPVVAACWAHLAEHGDSYDRDHLSLLLLSKFNRVGNFVRERDAPARANGIDPRTGAPPGKRGPRHV